MTRLDPKLLKKLCAKLQKSEKYVHEQISKRANRHNISAEAELVIWAKERGFGTNLYVQSLPPHIQNQISSFSLGYTKNTMFIKPEIKSASKNISGMLYEKWWVKNILLPLLVLIVGAFIVFKMGWI